MKGYKNILYVLVVALLVVGLVGCGCKKSEDSDESNTKASVSLTCVKAQEGATQTIKVGFSKDVVTSVDLEITADTSTFSAEEREAYKKADLCQIIGEEFQNAFSKCDATFEGLNAKVTASVDVEKYKDVEPSFTKGLSDIKSELVSEGFNCTEN